MKPNPIYRTNKPLKIVKKKEKIFRITDARLYYMKKKKIRFCLFYKPPRGGLADKRNRISNYIYIYIGPASTEGVIPEIFYFVFFSLHAGRKSFNVGPY